MAWAYDGPTIASLKTPNKEVTMGSELSRRGFLKLASLAGLGSVVVPQGRLHNIATWYDDLRAAHTWNWPPEHGARRPAYLDGATRV